MKRDGVRRLLILGAVLILIELFAIGIYQSTEHYTVVNGKLYPRNLQSLDLRNQSVTPELYAQYRRRLPGTQIRWTVPFQNGSYDSESTSLTVFTLKESDLSDLEYFSNLQTLDGRGCSEYALLARYQRAHPEVKVLYTVTIDGTSYDQDTAAVTVPNLNRESAALLECLTRLQTIHAQGCREYALLAELTKSHPEWEILYTVPLGETEFRQDVTNITAYYATAEQLDAGLAGLPNLTVLNLMQPHATGEELLALREKYPNISIRWQVNILGENLPDTTTELDLTDKTFTLEEVRSAAAYFPQLERVILGECGMENSILAQFREEMSEAYQVVWTIRFTRKLTARTDDTTFMPTREGEYYLEDKNNIQALAYCRDMICVDLTGSAVRDLSWASSMPNLRYLTLARTNVSDISDLSGCRNLIYLDLEDTQVRSYAPLLSLTNLEDLNLSGTQADSTPLRQMNWLKNLWWLRSSAYVRPLLQEALPNTHLAFSTQNGLWQDLPGYQAQADMLKKS